MMVSDKQSSRRGDVRRRIGIARRVRGLSLSGFLLFVVVVCGVYALWFRPADKGGKAEAAAAPARPEIVLYTTLSCEPCDRARTWLTQRQFAFEERKVETSAVYQQELEAFKSRIVPVILVNGEPQYGFLPAHLEDALRNAARRR